jgi:DNA-binding NarL/FixJ family response regulator
MIRVFVVAPTPMMRAGLRSLLTTSGTQIVGESADVDGFVAQLPGIDVLVVADEAQLEEIGQAVADNRSVALVVLSDNNERTLSVLRTLSLSGWSIVPLDAPGERFQAAVIAAAQGFIALPTGAAERQFGQRSMLAPMPLDTVDESLTAREREVLELLSRGLSNKLIARRLQISEHTVKFHVSSIYTKLGAVSRTDAVSRGVRRGLITL